MTVAPFLRIQGLRKSFGSHEVLKGVDLDVARGQVVSLIGPSGSGKSTFLRCVNQLEKFHSGLVELDGELIGYEKRETRSGTILRELPRAQLDRQRAEIGMVFQHFNLFPHMTVLQNIIEAPTRVRGIDPATARSQALDLLDQVGLADKAQVYPKTLSGGQQQRIAIARALAMRPKLMLFDEPTSALDPELVSEVLSVMVGVAREGMTMLVVTHEWNFARDLADQVAVFDAGQIIETGTPDSIFERPVHPRTREFITRSSRQLALQQA